MVNEEKQALLEVAFPPTSLVTNSDSPMLTEEQLA